MSTLFADLPFAKEILTAGSIVSLASYKCTGRVILFYKVFAQSNHGGAWSAGRLLHRT